MKLNLNKKGNKIKIRKRNYDEKKRKKNVQASNLLASASSSIASPPHPHFFLLLLVNFIKLIPFLILSFDSASTTFFSRISVSSFDSISLYILPSSFSSTFGARNKWVSKGKVFSIYMKTNNSWLSSIYRQLNMLASCGTTYILSAASHYSQLEAGLLVLCLYWSTLKHQTFRLDKGYNSVARG